MYSIYNILNQIILEVKQETHLICSVQSQSVPVHFLKSVGIVPVPQPAAGAVTPEGQLQFDGSWLSREHVSGLISFPVRLLASAL